MTTNELIDALRRVDPDGNHPVCINAVHDITSIVSMPSFCEGFLEKIDRCKNGNIIGAKVIGSGKKICIMQKSIQEAIQENPDIPIHYEDLHDLSRVHYQKLHSDWREEAKDIQRQLNWTIRDE